MKKLMSVFNLKGETNLKLLKKTIDKNKDVFHPNAGL